ncbi:MAG TPA: SPFH domain-containing protein [Oligoflexia bacterium]|nr:SPFH domain-containing protein [Oligoflexia bacterium]HMP49668.1 SPFH domain-containing protein [Oligoflexia bacterium]
MKRSGNSTVFMIAGLVLLSLVGSILYFTFRGSLVEVPTGHVSRVKTTQGFTGPVKKPSIFRLPSNWFGLNPSKAILAETSDHRVVENIPALYMPKDNLNLAFEVIGTFSVKEDEKMIEGLFERLTPKPTDDYYVELIDFTAVYSAYAQQALRTIAMEVLANYTIQEVLENLESVSKEVQDKVNQRLEPTPIAVRYCGLGKVVPPELIVKAQERAKEREIEIAKANATKAISLVKADADYQVGLKEQEIDLLEAETQVLADVVVSDAVSKAYIAQRSLRVLESLAKNPNASFLIPSAVFSEPSALLGLSFSGEETLPQTSAEREEKLKRAISLIEEAKKQVSNSPEVEAEISEVELGTESDQ